MPPTTLPAGPARRRQPLRATRRRSTCSRTRRPTLKGNPQRRGAGRWPRSSRPGAGLAARLRLRLQRRTGLRRQHQAAGGAGLGRRSRRVGDRRRCHLHRRAIFPGWAGRGCDRRSRRGRRLLLLRGWEQQPDRLGRQRHSLLGSSGIPRLRQLPGGAGRGRGRPKHCMDFNPGAVKPTHLRDHGRERRHPEGRPAVGGTVERCPHRPRRVSSRLGRETAQNQRSRQRIPRRGYQRQHREPETGRGSRLGKRHRRQRRSQPGDQRLLRGKMQ